MNSNYLHSNISERVISCFFSVYNELGYGFLEKVYENAMVLELKSCGLKVENQKRMDVMFKGISIGSYFADLLVEEKIVVELKSVDEIQPQHEAQLVNYLRASKIEVGLLLNFGPYPKIIRRVLTRGYKKNI